MKKFQTILGIILVAGSLLASSAEIPKPSYTRTMLKVSRSLPGETEELKVRTSEGNLATLIVKRRDKSENNAEQSNIHKITREPEVASSLVSENVTKTSLTKDSAQERKDEIRRSENRQIEELRLKTSNFSSAKDEPANRRISSDIKDASDKPEVASQSSVSAINERMIDYGNWTPLSKDGRALEVTEAKNDGYTNWKPVGTSPEVIPNDRTNFARYQVPANRRESLLLGRNFHDSETTSKDGDGTFRGRIIGDSPVQYAFLPHQAMPAMTRTNIGANVSKNRGGKNVPPEVTIRSEINVKSLPKRTAMSMDADGTPIIHGTRVPDEPMDKIQTWRNARVINNKLISDSVNAVNGDSSQSVYGSDSTAERQRFERFFKDVNRRYGRNFDDDRNVYFEWDPQTHQNPALKAEVYETRNENYRSNIQKRMLHPESMQLYPNSQMYTPESQKISTVALKTGVRAPVLQYAHPELGVQPAKILKNAEKRRPENFPENQNSFTEQRHKKKYVLNDKNVVDSYSVKNYYPNQHFYGLKRPNDQPFWVKISENLRNQFSTGVERVSQLTRPVFDPLVEATHKISQNLGLSRGNDQHNAQDKIGTVATGGSILIPALGLVASGAALGIGAVAVGRYLDVDMLKRGRNDGNDGDDADLDFENSRALEAVESGQSRGGEDGVFMIMEENDRSDRTENRQTRPSIDETGYVETMTRQRRSVDEGIKSSGTKPLRRTGADSLMEIVEIDVPTKRNTNIGDILKKIVNENGGESDSLVENTIEREDEPTDDLLQVETIAEEQISNVGGRLSRGARRNRRDVDNDRELDDVLQNLENSEVSEIAHVNVDWTNTPCAKRIFCDAMIMRGNDASIVMEKKMAALLGLIQPGAALQVSSHFQEVMEAVRKHDCSSFLCPQSRPGNVFF